MKKLIRRAGVVDFVEIHTVQITRRIRNGIRFVKQRRALGRPVGNFRRNAAPVGGKEGDLIKRYRPERALQRHIPRMHGGALRAPCKHGRVFLGVFDGGAVFAGKYRRPLGNVSVRPDLEYVVHGAEVDLHGCGIPRRPDACRERERAEIQQCEHGIEQRQRPHETFIAAVEPRASRLGGEYFLHESHLRSFRRKSQPRHTRAV